MMTTHGQGGAGAGGRLRRGAGGLNPLNPGRPGGEESNSACLLLAKARATSASTS